MFDASNGSHSVSSLFFFNDTATTEIYTLSLHDALPISMRNVNGDVPPVWPGASRVYIPPNSIWTSPNSAGCTRAMRDRKSTRLNSSHGYNSYAVFCLKKKNISTHPRSHTHEPVSVARSR